MRLPLDLLHLAGALHLELSTDVRSSREVVTSLGLNSGLGLLHSSLHGCHAICVFTILRVRKRHRCSDDRSVVPPTLSLGFVGQVGGRIFCGVEGAQMLVCYCWLHERGRRAGQGLAKAQRHGGHQAGKVLGSSPRSGSRAGRVEESGEADGLSDP